MTMPSKSLVTTLAEVIPAAATLIILILVSATIVFRSYALRRRQRALIAEAIANGTYVDPDKPPVVDRPKMFEMHIGEEEGAKPEETEFTSEKEKQRESVGTRILVDWDRMAVSLLVVTCPTSAQGRLRAASSACIVQVDKPSRKACKPRSTDSSTYTPPRAAFLVAAMVPQKAP